MIKKKTIKRAVIKKVVKRGKLLGNFNDQAKKMTKQQLIDHMAIVSNKPDNSTFMISRKFLKFVHGMSDNDIQNAIEKSKEGYKFKQDLSLYYRGQKSSEEIISKWKSKGITTKSELDNLVIKDKYEIPPIIDNSKEIRGHSTPIRISRDNIIFPQYLDKELEGLGASQIFKGNHIVNREVIYILDNIINAKEGLKGEFEKDAMDRLKISKTDLGKLLVLRRKERLKIPIEYGHAPLSHTPRGQRSFIAYGYTLYDKYRDLISKLGNDVKNSKIQEFLLDIADRRPEFAAHIYYILNGGDIRDDFESKIAKKFNDDAKQNFIQMMGRYRLHKSRTQHPVIFNKPDLMKDLRHIKMGRYENYNRDLIDQSEQNDYGSEGNYELQLRKHKKIKLLPKRKVRKSIIKKKIVKKPIRKVIKKCRCR